MKRFLHEFVGAFRWMLRTFLRRLLPGFVGLLLVVAALNPATQRFGITGVVALDSLFGLYVIAILFFWYFRDRKRGLRASIPWYKIRLGWPSERN